MSEEKKFVEIELMLDLDVIEKVKRIAKLAGVSDNDVINVTLATYLINHEEEKDDKKE